MSPGLGCGVSFMPYIAVLPPPRGGQSSGMLAGRNQQSISHPGETVPKYTWQSRMNLFEGINSAKQTISDFEKNGPFPGELIF